MKKITEKQRFYWDLFTINKNRIEVIFINWENINLHKFIFLHQQLDQYPV